LDELVHELVVNRLVQEQSRTGGATLAGVGEDGKERAVDGLVDVGVWEDDVRRLAAKLEGNLLDRSGAQPDDLPAGLCLAGEGELVDVWVLGNRRADGRAGSGQDVDDTL